MRMSRTSKRHCANLLSGMKKKQKTLSVGAGDGAPRCPRIMEVPLFFYHSNERFMLLGQFDAVATTLRGP